MRISDGSSDVCSSDLIEKGAADIEQSWNVGARWSPINERINAVQDAANELIGIVEQNRIIDPRIGIFQDAISSATHDLREAISKKRSEERRVGKECVSTCRSGWSPDHKKKKKK